jgi:hypothetical protein
LAFPYAHRLWTPRQSEHDFLKALRNDLGGPFLTATAEFVLDAVDQDAVGMIAAYRRAKGADMKLYFAYELVATAL